MQVSAQPLAIVAGLLALALTAAPAWGAKTKPVDVVHDAAVRVTAHDEDGQLCLIVIEGRSENGFACGGTSDAGVLLTVEGQAETQLVAAAVAATATSIEVRRAGELLGSGPTMAGEAYRGARAGSVRFAVVRLPRGAPDDGLRVRALDAGGVVQETLADDEKLVSDRTLLMSGRFGRARWSVSSERASELTPSVVDLDHETASTCVSVSTGTAADDSATHRCSADLPSEMVPALASGYGEPATADRCKPTIRVVHGILDGAVQRVSVLLGDGSRVTARTAAVPLRAQVVFVAAVPASEAVRSVRIEPTDGPPRVVTLAAAPLRVLCATPLAAEEVRLDGPDKLPQVFPPGPVSTIAATPPVRIADGPAGTLCLGLGETPFTILGCTSVSPYLSQARRLFDDDDAPTAFASALPARVATMRISAAGGAVRDIATIEAEGYAGRYAGLVRFAVAPITGSGELAKVDYLDEAGRVLYHKAPDIFDELSALDSRTFPAGRLSGRPGRPSLWQTASRLEGELSRCVTLTDGPAPAPEGPCENRGPGLVALLAASCATRRLTVAVAVPPGARVIARLTGGRTRRLALRRGAGLLTLAPAAGLRSLTMLRPGRSPRALGVNAPAGAAQCGWRAALTRK